MDLVPEVKQWNRNYRHLKKLIQEVTRHSLGMIHRHVADRPDAKPNPSFQAPPPQVIQSVIQVLRGCFPQLNRWLEQLPDPRRQSMCVYAAPHIWWHIILTFLFRAGSRNAFDEMRNTGLNPSNLGQFCGQGPNDPRFTGQPRVTCSDNAQHHADPSANGATLITAPAL